MSDCIPSVLSRRYLSRDQLGAGGMGQVVLVEDLHAGRRLRALKWVGSTDLEEVNVARHRHEYQLLSTWRHPNVLAVHDFCRLPSHGIQFFTMEHLRGPTLEEVLEPGNASAARRVIGQVLQALAFVHHQGWVHRDVKPHNVLLRDALRDVGRCRSCLIDFGLAERAGVPPSDGIVGSAHYMAPERFGKGPLDVRSDLYSVGVMLYQLVTGRLPFDGQRRVDIVLAHLNEEPADIRRAATMPLEAELAELVTALLAKDAADRPRDAHEVLAVLARSWPEVMASEPASLLAAYADRVHLSGWEGALAHATGSLRRCSPDRADERLEFLDDDASEVLPLASRVCGRPRGRCLSVVGERAEDRERFAAALVRRAEIVGVPQVEFAGRSASFSGLINRVAELATPRALVTAPRVQTAAIRIDRARAAGEAIDRNDAALGAEWLRRVGEDVPLLLVFRRVEAFEELAWLADSMCEFDREREPAGCQWLVLADRERSASFVSRWPGWATEIDLGGLDPESHVRWWTRRLGEWRPPVELESLLERECEGSPALLERLFRALIDSGVIERFGGDWAVGPRADLGAEAEVLPEGSALAVLEAVAAAGSGATVGLVAHLLDRPVCEVETVIEALEPVWLTRRDDHLEYLDLRDHFSVRESCPSERWIAYKTRAAEFWETEGAESFSALERLSCAWFAAGETERALAWTRRALADADVAGDVDGAHRLLGRAAEIVGALPEDLSGRWVSARLRWGPIDGVWSEVASDAAGREFAAQLAFLAGEYRRAAEFAAEVDAPGVELRLLAAEAIAVRGGDIGSTDPWVELTGVPGATRARAWDLALTATESGSASDAVDLAARLLVEAEDPDRSIPSAWVAYLFARRAELRGELALAVAAYRAAAYGFARTRHPRDQVRAIVRQAGVLASLGRGHEARSAARRAAELLPRVGGVVEREWLRRSPAVGYVAVISGPAVQEAAGSVR